MKTIYLDNNSTTRLDPRVREAMEPCWRDDFGNASSLHRLGQEAHHALDLARAQVAALIGASPREIVFTSGGTEADNLAILGTLAAYPTKRGLVTTAVEHPAVHDLSERLAAQGYRVTFVGVDALGHLDLDALDAAISEDTALVSVMHANNETGVIFPVAEAATLCAARGVPLHVDAVQSAGKLPLNVRDWPGVKLLSLSAHKIHGPKGAGALYVGKGARLRGLFTGGHQERDLRPGTENVPALVGFGEAARLAAERLQHGLDAIAARRDRLEAEIVEASPLAHVIGDRAARTCNTTLIGFKTLEAEALLIALSERGVCASSGSACSSGSLEPSHVLKAMGIDEAIAHGAVRFSLSHETTDAEIDEALRIVAEVVERLARLGEGALQTELRRSGR